MRIIDGAFGVIVYDGRPIAELTDLVGHFAGVSDGLMRLQLTGRVIRGARSPLLGLRSVPLDLTFVVSHRPGAVRYSMYWVNPRIEGDRFELNQVESLIYRKDQQAYDGPLPLTQQLMNS